MRICKACSVEKPDGAFHTTSDRYLRRVCKDCYNSGFRKTHTDPNDPERKRNRLAAMKSRLMSKFGMTMEQYKAMETEQGGKCKICGKPPSGRYTVLSVDHDHKTNKVRGLLCMRCNAELGWFEEHREAALRYLENR